MIDGIFCSYFCYPRLAETYICFPMEGFSVNVVRVTSRYLSFIYMKNDLKISSGLISTFDEQQILRDMC